MPAVNLSNRLNPNNIHFDRLLAAQYKRMSKPEKEALWAQDRLMQQRQVLPSPGCLPSISSKPSSPPRLWQRACGTACHCWAHLCVYPIGMLWCPY